MEPTSITQPPNIEQTGDPAATTTQLALSLITKLKDREFVGYKQNENFYFFENGTPVTDLRDIKGAAYGEAWVTKFEGIAFRFLDPADNSDKFDQLAFSKDGNDLYLGQWGTTPEKRSKNPEILQTWDRVIQAAAIAVERSKNSRGTEQK